MANLFLFVSLLFAFFYDNVIAIRCISALGTVLPKSLTGAFSSNSRRDVREVSIFFKTCVKDHADCYKEGFDWYVSKYSC